MEPITVTVQDARKALGVGNTTVYALINQRKLETIKIGRRRLIKTESIRALVDQAA